MFGRWHITCTCIILVWVILHGEPMVEAHQHDGANRLVDEPGDPASALDSGKIHHHHQHHLRGRRHSPNINPLYRRHADTNNALVHRRPRRQSSDKGYIVKLYVECPATVSAVGRMVLKADVPAYAFARCKNGNLTFNETDMPVYTLPITFGVPSVPTQCRFYKKTNVDVYTMMVEIGWGEESNEMMHYKRQELVTCGYDAHGNSSSVSHRLHDFVIAPKENENLLGAETRSLFTLTVINVLDVSIDNWDFNIGRLIRLKATVGGSQQIAGMRALSCDARNDAGDSYAVLRGGCGDGVIFPKTAGFYTVTGGSTVYSPYFVSFKLRGGIDLRFECTFVVCTSACQGNSCKNVA